METAQFLANINPFIRLAASPLTKLAASFQEKKLQPGEMFIKQGQPVQWLGVIRSGSAQVIVLDGNGLELVCGNLQHGDLIFDLALLSGTVASASIVCLEQTSFLVQPLTAFIQSIEIHPPLKSFFYHNVTMGIKWYHEINCGRHSTEYACESINTFQVPFSRKALLYIDQNYHKPINLGMVAQEVAMSKFHFSRLFKQHVGLSFKQYLNRVRVKAAKELLSRKGYTVTEASFAVGFNDSSYFARVYREVEGCSPRKHLPGVVQACGEKYLEHTELKQQALFLG